MTQRYTLDEFLALIRCEGGLVRLFCETGIDAKTVPEELEEDITEINILWRRIQRRFESLSATCGYDEGEGN